MWLNQDRKVLHIERFQSTSLLDVLGKFPDFFEIPTSGWMFFVLQCPPESVVSRQVRRQADAGESGAVCFRFSVSGSHVGYKTNCTVGSPLGDCNRTGRKKPGTLRCPALNLPGLFLFVFFTVPLLLLRSCSAEREGRIRYSAGWHCTSLW